MARIPFVTRNEVRENERAAYDAFAKQRGTAPAEGPYGLLLHMPEVALKFEALRLCIRDEASLAQPIQELVMLAVAREMDTPYIWQAHATAARELGVRGDIVDNLRERKPLTGLTAEQQVAVDYTRELLRNRKVARATFDRAMGAFGQRGTMTLTALIASYANLAFFMNAYELEAPARAGEPPLPV